MATPHKDKWSSVHDRPGFSNLKPGLLNFNKTKTARGSIGVVCTFLHRLDLAEPRTLAVTYHLASWSSLTPTFGAVGYDSPSFYIGNLP